MGNALEIKCPYCGYTGKHKVIKTVHQPYKWNEETDVFFKDRLGKGLSYRLRKKKCVYSLCKGEFDTVEMLRDYLKVMAEAITDLDQSKKQEKMFKNKVISLEEEIKFMRKQKADLEIKLIIQEEKYRRVVTYWQAAPIEKSISLAGVENFQENEEDEESVEE
ncbi:hypothetical protein [Laspinema olomoucense]|uniref:Uncharacterized protein n=1 Tax=Laspinema olomoucense D3b TaxID=2953688 RepID=A0ABT2NDQ1_9CYAN|nr:hypothetical protein [Laspinema sp. D3b]MCT7980831.1 hypothetical protein [Laspinema sp. D3b]